MNTMAGPRSKAFLKFIFLSHTLPTKERGQRGHHNNKKLKEERGKHAIV